MAMDGLRQEDLGLSESHRELAPCKFAFLVLHMGATPWLVYTFVK